MRAIAVVAVILALAPMALCQEMSFGESTAWSIAGMVGKSYRSAVPGVELRVLFGPDENSLRTVYTGGNKYIILPDWSEVSTCVIEVDLWGPMSRQKVSTNDEWQLLPDSRNRVFRHLEPGLNEFKLYVSGLRKSSLDLPIGHIGLNKKVIKERITLCFVVQSVSCDDSSKPALWRSFYAPQGLVNLEMSSYQSTKTATTTLAPVILPTAPLPEPEWKAVIVGLPPGEAVLVVETLDGGMGYSRLIPESEDGGKTRVMPSNGPPPPGLIIRYWILADPSTEPVEVELQPDGLEIYYNALPKMRSKEDAR